VQKSGVLKINVLQKATGIATDKVPQYSYFYTHQPVECKPAGWCIKCKINNNDRSIKNAVQP
jgi:hypothetical protein